VYHGKDEVAKKLFANLGRRLAGPIAFAPERFIAEGEYVVMQAKGKATSKSGKPYNNSYCIIARFADGKIKTLIDYVDTELITSALGR
jgi:ketosteroid isomerase-like protein